MCFQPVRAFEGGSRACAGWALMKYGVGEETLSLMELTHSHEEHFMSLSH